MGGVTVARINKSALTRLEIIRVASRMFLERGYTATTIKAISTELEMSTGNLTFYFPSKEHLLAELVELLGAFQWELMAREADEGLSSLMALCLELAAMAAMCEENGVAKDFYLATQFFLSLLQIALHFYSFLNQISFFIPDKRNLWTFFIGFLVLFKLPDTFSKVLFSSSSNTYKGLRIICPFS